MINTALIIIVYILHILLLFTFQDIPHISQYRYVAVLRTSRDILCSIFRAEVAVYLGGGEQGRVVGRRYTARQGAPSGILGIWWRVQWSVGGIFNRNISF